MERTLGGEAQVSIEYFASSLNLLFHHFTIFPCLLSEHTSIHTAFFCRLGETKKSYSGKILDELLSKARLDFRVHNIEIECHQIL